MRDVSRCAGAALFMLAALSACDPMMIDGCASNDQVRTYCGFEKPEDLEPLGESRWLLVSELGGGDRPGAIVALDPESGETLRLEATVTPSMEAEQCGSPPIVFRPRGFHLSDMADGGFRLLVVNGTSPQRIERFRIDLEGGVPRLAWQGCVSVPDIYLPNDVAATEGQGFVVSHMYAPPRSAWQTVKFFLGLDTGYAVAWTPDEGWGKVAESDASFPNGIEYDVEAGIVIVGATYGQTLSIAKLDGSGGRKIRIPVQSDNITWSEDGRILAVGHTGLPLIGTSGCRGAGGKPCSFPFAVVAVDPKTNQQTVIYSHDEGVIPGASVALLHRGDLYFGTVFGDRVSRVQLSSSIE
jgi:hypothetical protein